MKTEPANGDDSFGSSLMRPAMPRRPWITAFIGYVLRRGAETDPDTAFHTADSLYPDSRYLDPEVVADSTFGPRSRQDRDLTEPGATAR